MRSRTLIAVRILTATDGVGTGRWVAWCTATPGSGHADAGGAGGAGRGWRLTV
jgi:hypothetical protein